jgi:Tfp pilus assembly protein PilO
VTDGAKTHQRRKQQYVFAVLTALAVLNVAAFYLLFYRPVRSEFANLEASIARLQGEIIQRRNTLERMEDAERRLENAQEARQVFLSSNLVSRESGYAALLPDMAAMARRSGVQHSEAQYLIADAPMYGVYPVQILEPVTGSYDAVRRYIRELEASSRFFLLDSIAIQRGEGASNQLEVELAMSTFFAESGDE